MKPRLLCSDKTAGGASEYRWRKREAKEQEKSDGTQGNTKARAQIDKKRDQRKEKTDGRVKSAQRIVALVACALLFPSSIPVEMRIRMGHWYRCREQSLIHEVFVDVSLEWSERLIWQYAPTAGIDIRGMMEAEEQVETAL